jgi:hypothetical protein
MNQTSLFQKELLYFGKPVKVLAEDKTHYLIQFENGIKICTNKNTFKK